VSLTRSAPTARLNPVPEPPSDVDPLQAETAALRSAQRAIRSGDPERALALIREQDATYRRGALAQERAAARIFALCDLGRTEEARTETRRFARQWPRSPLLSRIQSGSCAP
jgi:outer membrane protein assembly factor BamD (BamD/ComL family)